MVKLDKITYSMVVKSNLLFIIELYAFKVGDLKELSSTSERIRANTTNEPDFPVSEHLI